MRPFNTWHKKGQTKRSRLNRVWNWWISFPKPLISHILTCLIIIQYISGNWLSFTPKIFIVCSLSAKKRFLNIFILFQWMHICSLKDNGQQIFLHEPFSLLFSHVLCFSHVRANVEQMENHLIQFESHVLLLKLDPITFIVIATPLTYEELLLPS